MSSLPRPAIQLPLFFEKPCARCGETKPLDAFYARGDGRHGVSARCKDCVRAVSRAYYQRDCDKPGYRERQSAHALASYHRHVATARPRAAARMAESSRRRRAAGVCPWCGGTLVAGKKACAGCLAAARKTAAEVRADRRARRVCIACGSHGMVEALQQKRRTIYCQLCYVKSLANGATGKRTLGVALWDKLVAQNFTCPYSGEHLVLGVNASIDHIYPRARFPHLRASVENLEWVTLQINHLKRDLTRDEFLALVGRIGGYCIYGSLQPVFDSAVIV